MVRLIDGAPRRGRREHHRLLTAHLRQDVVVRRHVDTGDRAARARPQVVVRRRHARRPKPPGPSRAPELAPPDAGAATERAGSAG